MILSKIRFLPFAIALLCLSLPFVSFSCDNVVMDTKTGFQLAAGFSQGYEQVAPNAFILVFIFAAIAGIVFSLLNNKFSLAAIISGGIGFIALVSFLIDTNSRVSGEMKSMGIAVSYEYGFVLTLLFILFAIALQLLSQGFIFNQTKLAGAHRAVQFTPPGPQQGAVSQQSVYTPPENLSDNNLSWPQPLPLTREAKAPKLIGISGQYAGRTIDLSPGEVRIGRDMNSSNLIYDHSHANISRNHCNIKFDRDSEKFILEDTSTNGTYIYPQQRLKRNQPVYLDSGTRFFLGDPSEQYLVSME